MAEPSISWKYCNLHAHFSQKTTQRATKYAQVEQLECDLQYSIIPLPVVSEPIYCQNSPAKLTQKYHLSDTSQRLCANPVVEIELLLRD